MITTIVITDLKTNDLNSVIENKEQIDRNIDTAIDDGVTSLAEVDGNNNIIINKEAAVNSFFLSLHSAFGVLSDKVGQDKLNLYIPVVVVTMEDGYYVFYSDEYIGSDGHAIVSKRWSEKFPYSYEDDDFIYGFTLGDVITLYDKNGIFGESENRIIYSMDYHDFRIKDEYASFQSERPDSILLNDEEFGLIRKRTIIDCIESTMAYYTTRHNKIAANYGITYQFSLPVIRIEEWAPYLDDASMFAAFQGYPYGGETGETYNRFTSAGAKVSKSKMYYLEQSGWYLIYHLETCPELKKEGIILYEEPHYSVEACAAEGAYSCPICCGNTGVTAPDYVPVR
jgi:hypothetical protein